MEISEVFKNIESVRYLQRYQSEGLRVRCVLKTKDGRTKRSRWLETKPLALKDAAYWVWYYGRRYVSN